MFRCCGSRSSRARTPTRDPFDGVAPSDPPKVIPRDEQKCPSRLDVWYYYTGQCGVATDAAEELKSC